MQGYVFEIENDALKKYFGYKSFLDLPLFHKTLGDCIFNELMLCGADDIKSFSFDEYVPCDNSDYDDVLVLFSNKFIIIENEAFIKSKSYLKEFYLSDFEGKICGIYCTKKIFASIIEECSDFTELYNKINEKYFDFPVFCCVKKCITISKCNDYFEIIKFCFDDKFYLNLPEIAQGIYTSSKIPKGDYVIVPPVYIGEGVQIERGSVIGPFSVIYNNVLVATKSDIKRSVVFENTYISDNCFIDGTLCCGNTSVRRNSAIFKGCVIGSDSIVGESTVIENDTLIPAETKISNIKAADICCNSGHSENGTVFYGYTPSKAALLGCCLGNVLEMPAIAVMGDGELNSTSLKLSLLGGLISAGSGCYDFGNGFLSSVYYYMNFCELRYGLFVNGNSSGTVITLIDSENNGLSHLELNKLGRLLSGEQVKFAKSYQCKKIRVISSLGRLYISNLVNSVKYPLSFLPVFECENKSIRVVVNTALSKLKINSTGESPVFKINEYGTQLTAEYKGRSFNNQTLIRIVSYYSFIDGDKENSSDFSDAVIMCFKLLHILGKHKINLIEAENYLPHVYVADGEVDFHKALSSLASHISEYAEVSYRGDKLIIDKDDSKISISEGKNNRLKISVKASSFEVAEELTDKLIEYIKRDINKG